jgi:hypothetical protein
MAHTLRCEIGGQKIDVAGEILPDAGGARNIRLTAESALDPNLASNARDLIGKSCQRIGHVVDGVFQLEDFAFDVEGDLARYIAPHHRGRDLGDVANLRGQVARHEVHVVGQALPGTGDAGYLRLAAEFALGPDLAGDG